MGWTEGAFRHAERNLIGSGFGVAALDGLIRLDLAKGLKPARGWRADLYLEIR